ncbi:GNAT family N-acetyltransferase [Bradyrhizobium sp. SYSU BS000235]|uniref:GNAT family N-acetyltransferase n=1 Tax=Bradyrhizobium sp. SYSU BS000235 TaxID=3411332 RepID=UPI003C760233
MTFTVSDLRQQPAFFDAVADRIWRAWWKERGLPIDYITGRLRENMNVEPIPFALVAHDGETFLGTASVIASDLEDRQHYTPWVAAVWVEPEHRQQQIGRTLVGRAAGNAFDLGIGHVYLCAPKIRRNFYLRQGWTPVEEEVGERRVTVFVQHKSQRPAEPGSPERGHR